MSNRKVKKIVNRYADSQSNLPNGCQIRGFTGRQHRALMARARFYGLLGSATGSNLEYACQLVGRRIWGTVAP